MTKRNVYDCDRCKQAMEQHPRLTLMASYESATAYNVTYHFCEPCADGFGRFMAQKGAR